MKRIAMGKVGTSGCALALLGSLVFSTSVALAQTCECTPVVFAFRHAEDTNPPAPHPQNPIFALTPTGQKHGELYPTMVDDVSQANNFCSVTKVYATTKADKEGDCGSECTSATNAFATGTRLARNAMGSDPITTVGKDKLYEYLGNGNGPPKSKPGKPPKIWVYDYNTRPARALRDELVKTAKECSSSAIFWTSQGLHVLGGAITGATSNVPDKNGAVSVDSKLKGTPPRNAVYIFEAVGSAPDITGFSDITRRPKSAIFPNIPEVRAATYVQCYNHVEYGLPLDTNSPQFIPPKGDPETQDYYCGFGEQSNLGGKPGESCVVDAKCSQSLSNEDNEKVLGKICNTMTSMLPNIPPARDTFGACQ